MPCCILHPSCKVKSIWNTILAFLLIYTATVMPYKIAFIDNEIYDGWWFWDLTIDALFFVDIIMNICSAYYDSDGVL